MTTTIDISEEAFVSLMRPVPNHLVSHASFDWGEGRGTLFETYGDELDYVMACDPSNVWTLLSGDSDSIASGFHFVNRIGYFVTEVSVPSDVFVHVMLEQNSEEPATFDSSEA